MGVYIKDMKMPENCAKCMMRDAFFCMASDYMRIPYGAMHRREEWCPLVDLGKHGRLIDADKLKDKMRGKWTVYDYEAVGTMPTIVEAEDGT